EQRRADGNAAIQIAVEAEVADATAVRAARGLLKLGNNLHCANLGRTAERAGRKGRSHEVEWRASGAESAFDLRHDVHDVTVALDDHQVFDLHAAEIAHAPDVVAGQINQHHMLGPFLGVGQQLSFERGVLGRRLATPARAGDGPDLDLAVLTADMNLRRRAYEGHAVQLEQKHVGRGIDAASGAVDVDGRRLDRRAEALRANDLDDIASGNVFFCLDDVGEELFL